MGIVRRQEKGLIYFDEFNKSELDSGWEVLTDDHGRYNADHGVLELRHGESPIYMFFTELTEIEEFVFDVKNEYNPTVEGDSGGLIVYADDENVVKLEEYFDAEKGMARSYPWIRLVRSFNVYSAYWSEDGKIWRFIGNQEVISSVPKIGLFLESGTQGEPLLINHIRIQRSARVKVDNLKQGYQVELRDQAGKTLEKKICKYENTSIMFDFQRYGYPFTGSFAVTLPDGNRFESSDILSIYGGDTYYFEPRVDLYYREYSDNGEFLDMRLQDNQERFLGYMSSGQSVTENVLFIAKNSLNQGVFQNVNFELASYRGDQYQNVVRLAPDVEGEPGAWSMQVNATEITPESPYQFWVRVERLDTSTNYEAQVTFGIKVSSTYI
ncbi:hypothetical protein [Paenibacillus sp. W2I17]|uniref:hypothetical protein n=1 Tax=Paenibacillus sp. W2I17 TaxID=3042311 RepID=UPI00278A64FB|nr:hypothetical protein [Paenibacillus sp. W2I17]MDQ0655352.1 hypothetical protein [Paenibacillus sp. W2I17]